MESNISKKPNYDQSILESNEVTTINNQIMDPEKPKKNINKNFNKNFAFNVPVDNRFEELNKRNTTNITPNNADASPNKLKKNNIPPITVIGANNYASAISFVSEIANKEFNVKYMSIGVKIHVNKLEHYSAIKEKLISSNIEFYSHDLNPEKFVHYIASGLNKVSLTEITDELKDKGFDVANITEIPIKNPRFLNEGCYRISFKAGTTKFEQLSRVKLNHTTVKWSLNKNTNKRITQCRNCQKFGHGIRNCHVTSECENCGENHNVKDCSSPTTKCANCSGDHPSTSVTCPNRQQFIEMRMKMSSKNNKTKPSLKTKDNLLSNNALNSPIEFPELPSWRTKTVPSTSSNLNDPNPWSFGTRWPISTTSMTFNNVVNQSTSHTQIDLFTGEEIKTILPVIFNGLRKCQSREDQLQLMFEVAAKYIYIYGNNGFP